MRIDSSETLLSGKWLATSEGMVADVTSGRIDDLVQFHLRELAKDSTGWDILYKDPEDGRLWELTYPNSDMLGGGPPQLRNVSAADALNKYGSDALR